jgi:carbon monoxide dehydrogenase subunit G
MIETEQTVTIRQAIENVWTFARDIRGWAGLMPGMQDCEVIDDDNSRWTLKVGVGGLVRTVKVDVHVDQWHAPSRVFFTYKLQGDPVQGGGSYHATATGRNETEVKLHVQVLGSGPMAPMWEAMGKPLLPQLAKGFAEKLRDRIEEQAASAGGPAPAASATETRPEGFFARLKRLLNAIFGKKNQARALR